MTSIYLIRHAEAEGNLYRIAQGQYNSILTDRGWRQVAALARRRHVRLRAIKTISNPGRIRLSYSEKAARIMRRARLR